MSYCRWSSDWFRCDLYCYEDVLGGYTTHVAPIGLSRDGETFNDPDLTSFLARVVSLKDEGYRVPDDVLDDIREEIVAASPLPDATDPNREVPDAQ